MINRQTYEEYFLLYLDGELSPLERLEVERFAEANPELKKELDLLRQSVFVPDENVVFDNKEILYRKEEKAAVVFFSWRRIAVAAVVLLSLGAAGWMYLSNRTEINEQTAHHAVPTKESDAIAGRSVEAATNTKQAPENKGTENVAVQVRPQKEKGMKASGKRNRNNVLVNRPNDPPDDHIEVTPVPEEVALKQSSRIVDNVALTNEPKEKINIAVRARNIQSEIKPADNTIHYVDENDLTDDGRIYVANTSFSKRNGLRVVFRKASRIIDRITTLQ